MKKAGRNDPCPCGSGLKYKKCCLSKQQDETSRLDRARSTARQATDMITERLAMQYGKRILVEAWHLYPPGDKGGPPEELDLQLFLPWCFYHWKAEEGRTPALVWLDKAHKDADPDLRAYVKAASSQPMTFFEVLAVEPGRGVQVRDILCDRECFVQDVSASQGLVKWLIVFGKVVEHRGFRFFEGLGSSPLPPSLREPIVESVAEMCDVSMSHRFEPGELLGLDVELLDLYREAQRIAREKPPPRLVNTDNEPLVMCASRYRFEPERRADLVDILAGIEDLWSSDDEGGDPNEYTWTRAGNRMHEDWDNTNIGMVLVGDGELVLETNSRERHADLRSRLESACAGLIQYLDTEASDLNDPAERDRMMSRQPAEEEDDGDPIPEEVGREIMAGYLERHYEKWPDMSLPALDGLSPRQAVKTAEGRRKVETILRDMECRQDLDKVPHYDFDRIRQVLGLL